MQIDFLLEELPMPRMSVKASEITEPHEMFARIAYRNERLRTRVDLHEDPVKFTKMMASRNKSDLRRLAELLGYELDR